MKKNRRHRLPALLLTAAMLMSLLAMPVFAADTPMGLGTKDDPYLIENQAQLEAIQNDGSYYLLTKDLALDQSFSGIALFHGTFDGGGNTISGLSRALFGDLAADQKTEIKNLKIVCEESTTTEKGTVFAKVTTATDVSGGQITLENVHTTIKGTSSSSGLAGEPGNTAITISNCSVVVKNGATIKDGSSGAGIAGGLIRHLRGNSSLKNSFVYIEAGGSILASSSGNKNAIAAAGGLAGAMSNNTKPSKIAANISNCYVINEGTIRASVLNETAMNFAGAGAVAGADYAPHEVNLENCYVYNTGTVETRYTADDSIVTSHGGILYGRLVKYAATVNPVNVTGLVAYGGGVPMVGTVETGYDQSVEGCTSIEALDGMKDANSYSSFSLNDGSSLWLRDDGKSPVYKDLLDLNGLPYLRMEDTPALSPLYAYVDGNTAAKDISAAVTGVGGVAPTLLSVTKGGQDLTADSDYTYSNGTLTIKDTYIASLQAGATYRLDLVFGEGLPVGFYIHVNDTRTIKIEASADGSASFADAATEKDVTYLSSVEVFATAAEGYVLSGWKVGTIDQPDSAREAWTYTWTPPLQESVTTITPVFQQTNAYVKFALSGDKNSDMTGTVVTFTKDGSTPSAFTWDKRTSNHWAMEPGNYTYTVEKQDYITLIGSVEVDGTNPAVVSETMGLYYVGPYDQTVQSFTSENTNGGYTLSYSLENIRAVSGELTVTLPEGVMLKDGSGNEVTTDVNDLSAIVTGGEGVSVGGIYTSATRTLRVTWGVEDSVSPHYLDTMNGAATVLSFPVAASAFGSVSAVGKVADNKTTGGPDIYTKTDLSVDIGITQAAKPEAVFDGGTMQLTNVTDGMQYRIGETGTWAGITGTIVDLTGLVTDPCTIQIRQPGNGASITDSEIQEIAVTKAAAPSGSATNVTGYGARDGAISINSYDSGVTYQISGDSGATWADATVSTEGKIENLAAGTYLIRVKAAGTALTSEPSASLTVEDYVRSSAKEITAFQVTVDGVVYSGIITDTAITLTLPYGAALTALTPQVTHTGSSVDPESGAEQDFTDPVIYTVTAEDETTKAYTVTIAAAEPDTFTLSQSPDPSAAHGRITSSPASPIAQDAQVTLTVEPDEGYQLTEGSLAAYRSGEATTAVDITEGKLTMPGYDVIVTAEFTAISYRITYDLGGGQLAGGESNPESYTVETDTFTLHAPIRSGYTFTGWTWEGVSEPVLTVTLETGTTGDKAFTANWSEDQKGVGISGQVSSYNPGNATTVTLYASTDTAHELALYTAEIAAEAGNGQTTQSFTVNGVAAGTYDLVVSKGGHLDFIITSVVVGTEPVDLTQHSNSAISTIALLAGDIDGNGTINLDDLNTVWNAANYDNESDQAANKRTDINGNGFVNVDDLNLVWNEMYYDKNSAVDCTVSY